MTNHLNDVYLSTIMSSVEGNSASNTDSNVKVVSPAVQDSSSFIQDGHFVILKSEKSSRLVQLNSKKPLFFHKRSFDCVCLIGQPWNQVFAMSGSRGDCKLTAVPYEEYVDHLSCASSKVMTERQGQDNRDLVDENRSQKLKREEIEQLKRQKTSAVEIVQSLVENSESFQEKTGYSQQKYLKKKLKKYDSFVQVCRPTVRALSELYWSQSPLKLGMLRPDSLALMLAQANILPEGKYLVMDSYLGLLVASVLERCPLGQVIQVLDYQGYQSSTRQAVEALGLDCNDRHFLVDFELAKCLACGSTLRELPSTVPSENEGRRAMRVRKTLAALNILQQRDIDGLLINCRGDVSEATTILLSFVQLSRNFVVFSPYLEELTHLYDIMKARGGTAMLKISESWIRAYQVLEDRTHPEINMQGASGYILVGIKCE